MNKPLLSLALALACAHPALADEWMVEAHYPDQAALTRAASRFQHVIVDPERRTLRVDTDDAGIAALEDAGLTVTIDQADTAKLRAFQARMRDAIASGVPQLTGDGYPSIPGYACYRTVEGAYQTMDDLVAAYPTLAAIDEIGPTWEKTQDPSHGYAMRALRITNFDTLASDSQRPVFVAFGSIHAREYTPAELLTRMAEWLLQDYGSDPQATWLVDHVDFRLILQANPDGRKKAETGISWRKNTNTVDGACPGTPDGWSQPGIDLNRNFPFHWHTTGESGSSSDRCDQTYRGPSAGSEPETQNLVRYVAGTPSGGSYVDGALPDRRHGDLVGAAPEDYAGLFFDIHSYSQLVLWSWGDTTTLSPNDAALRSLGRRIAWFNGYTPEAAWELYFTDGTTDDTFYGLIGAPSYTIELGVDFFESCTTFQNTTFPKNFAALKYAARGAAAPYRLPKGPDAYNLAVSAPAQGAGGPYVTLTATIDETRYSTRRGTQTTYPIQAAYAYVDTLPWQAGATPIALSAVDGAFDAKTEAVRGDISLAGLAPGKHLVYVQGVNTLDGGTPGTPDAIFVDVGGSTTTVTVTPRVAGDGSINPSTPQTVPAGTTLQFTATPATGHHTTSVDGCPGTFVAPVFTTAPLQADCTLTATFNIDQYTIGGTISGLAANGLALKLNGGANLVVAAGATSFTFPGTLAYGTTYDVTVAMQPTNQTCTVGNGHGTATGNVGNVVVTCATNRVTVTPTVVGDGTITPSTPQDVAIGTTLDFTVTPGTGQHVRSVAGCPGSFAAPIFHAGPIQSACTLTATFDPDLHTVSGSVGGLTTAGLALRLNGGSDLPIPADATDFRFPDPLAYGSDYAVTISAQPATQQCTLLHGTGTVSGDVTDVAVSCAPGGDGIFEDGFEAN